MTSQEPNPRVVIRGTTFECKKLLPHEGFEVLEVIRPAMAAALADIPADADLAQAIGMVLGGVPSATRRVVQNELFREVWFSNRLSPTPQRVADDIGTAFTGLEAAHIYEVLGRAFAANFTGSLDVIRSMFEAAGPTMNRFIQEIFQDSSPDQSTQD